MTSSTEYTISAWNICLFSLFLRGFSFRNIISVCGKPVPPDCYFPESLHGRIEDLWDKACTPAAVLERIVVADTEWGKIKE